MRFTVTALGSAGDKPVGVVVGQIARYLIAPVQSDGPGAGGPAGGVPSGADRPGEESVSRYYADRGDTPGRWLGVGASGLGLTGDVDYDEFHQRARRPRPPHRPAAPHPPAGPRAGSVRSALAPPRASPGRARRSTP
jgi:hypothetical protein